MNLQSKLTCAPGITSITCSNQFNGKEKIQNPVEETKDRVYGESIKQWSPGTTGEGLFSGICSG